MSRKSLVMLGLLIGSVIGGYVPVLFDQSFFSTWSIIGNTLGGLLGIFIAYKLSSD
jgi:hypothetical protein